MCDDIDGKTIHSYLGFVLSGDDDGDYTLRKKNNHRIESCDYLIVDESSMLTRQLINELQKYADIGIVSKKIILVGDEVQLQLDKFVNLSRYPKFELTVQMRQKADNALSNNLLKLRHKIETNGKSFDMKQEDNVLHFYDDHREFLSAYKASKHEKVIIAYQNQTVSAYNRNIKKYVLNHEDQYNAGDLVYPMSPVINNGNIVIKNREIVQILSVETTDDFTVITTTDYHTINVPHTKTWLKQKLEPYAEAKDWRTYYTIKESFNFVHHTFAGTAHSLQGASVDEVWIDYTDIIPPNDPAGFETTRIFYVALSRAKIKAHIFHGDKRDYKGLK